MASIFTKIIQGELPSFKLFEDELTIGILTIQPINPGHCLVIPKKEVDEIVDIESESYLRVMENGRKLSKVIKKTFPCKRVGLALQGFEVPHFHLHLIPLNTPADFSFTQAKDVGQEVLKDHYQRLMENIKDEF